MIRLALLALFCAWAHAQQAKKPGGAVLERPVECASPGGGAQASFFAARDSGHERSAAVVIVPDSAQEGMAAEVRALSKLLAARGLGVLELAPEKDGRKIAAAEEVLGAARCLVERKLADSRRLGVLGYGWGGHGALTAVALSSETWSAAIGVGGIFDLYAHYQLTQELPPDTPESETAVLKAKPKLLEERFPIQTLETVRVPILLFHGADDARVPRQESDRLYARLLQHRVPVGLILYPKEGHAFTLARNRDDFHRRVAEFFDKKLRLR